MRDLEMEDLNERDGSSLHDPKNGRPDQKNSRKAVEAPVRKKPMRNSQFSFVAYLFLFLFLAMSAYFVWFLYDGSGDYLASSYNSLQNLPAEWILRGKILSSEGEVLAESRENSSGDVERVYPYGRLFAHAVGYVARGKTGIESRENYALLSSHTFILDRIADDLLGSKSPGDSVVSTLSVPLQQAAYEALGDYDGAVIAMEPSTGKILCMVSKPDFDPATVEENWDLLNAEGSSVLYNRATQGQYAPGSVFKIFTLLEYYRENGSQAEDYCFDCTGAYQVDGSVIHCAGNKAHGEQTLKEAFMNSCNGAFADLGLSIDNNQLRKLCESFGFNETPDFDMTVGKSRMSLKNSDDTALTMETAIGQGNTMVTPLQMLLTVSAVCNNGTMMEPCLVDHIENEDGDSVKEYHAKELSDVMTREEAAFLEDYLGAVAEGGTASALNGQSYKAYGKTGTAQISDTSDTTNAWFCGYARSGNDEIAIAVIVEHSGGGSTYAVPVAKAVFDVWQ